MCLKLLQALDLVPKKVHDRSPIFLGSYDDVEQIKTLYAAAESNGQKENNIAWNIIIPSQ